MKETLFGLRKETRLIKLLLEDIIDGQQRKKVIKTKHNYKTLKKIRVSLKGNFKNFIKLHTPAQMGVWKNTAFLSTLERDVDLVINRPNRFLTLSKEIEKNWLLHIEPPSYIKLLGLDSKKILDKFGRVYTNDPKLYEQGGKYIPSPPYVHWHHAINAYTNNASLMSYDYDFLKNCVDRENVQSKNNIISVINSNVNNIVGHKQRANFITNLCEKNINIDLYGHSYWSKYKQYKGNAQYGKWPIYSKSRYALVIENESSPYYWSEKFTDALLCYSMPIYYGSTQINRYFPEGSYIALDINNPKAHEILEDVLKSDYYEKNFDNLIKARNLVLSTHNMFNFFDSQVNNYKS